MVLKELNGKLFKIHGKNNLILASYRLQINTVQKNVIIKDNTLFFELKEQDLEKAYQ